MQIRTVVLILAASAAFAQSNTPAAKPEAVLPKVEATTAPTIATSKLWRLLAKAQSLRIAANQTKESKAADAADAEVQAEQDKLAASCGPTHVLGYAPPTSPEAGDLACVTKPKPEPLDKVMEDANKTKTPTTAH